jgi:D-hexose-6-phosphate mutarotase
VELDQTEQAIVAACSELQLIPASAVFGRSHGDAEPLPPILKVSNRQCDATFVLQGAQVLGFKPTHCAELLWLSPNAALQSNMPVRGGIPVCLPWFGVNQQDPGKPKHGFARTSRWRLERASTDDQGTTVIQLGLRQYATQPHPLFNFAFSAELSVSFGCQLHIVLGVRNCSATCMPLSWALHSYHPAQDLEQLRIIGLENTEYLDNTRQLQRFTQQGEPKIRGEFDRVYLGVNATQTIMGTPGIRVSGINAPSAIVWNPGAKLAASMPDLGENTHRHFVCLERGAVFDNAISLAPQATMQASITIEADVAEREA